MVDDKKSTDKLVCYLHKNKSAIGACVGCGKFICKECSTQVKNKNYCKSCVDNLFSENEKLIDKLENNKQQNVFMNSSSTSSASSASSSFDFSNKYNHKDKTTTALLAFFLGGFGVHKFYLNQSGLGILYLVFFWTFIPMLLGMVECILFAIMSDQEFNNKYN